MYSIIGDPPSFFGGSHFNVNDVFVIPKTSSGPLGGPGVSNYQTNKICVYLNIL